MRRSRPDQAEGLRRRLSAGANCSIVALAAAAGEVGKRTLAVNLAAALAAGGRKVVLLQGAQSDGAASLPQALGAVARTTQPQSIVGLCEQVDAVASALQCSQAPSMAMLAAPELFLGLQLWRPAQVHSLRNALERLGSSADVLLVDTPTDAPCRQAQQLGARSITLVVTPSRPAITATYRMLKTLRPEVEPLSFQVVVNKAQDLDQARRVFDNIAYAVRRYLSSSIDFLGYLPKDNAFQADSSAPKTVIEHHPESTAAQLLRTLAGNLISPAPSADASDVDSLLLAIRGERDSTSHFHAISH